MDYLRQIDPSNPHPILICLDQEEMLVGRHIVPSLANFSRVSRYHACFTKDKGSWYVKDLGSEYNLYVNFTPVGRTNRKLELGDIIGFGTATLSGDGGFVSVLKRQDTNANILALPIEQIPVVQNALARTAGETSCNPTYSRTVASIAINQIKQENSEFNVRQWITPLTPPKESPAYVKTDPSPPCTTHSENVNNETLPIVDCLSSDDDVQIICDGAVKLPSWYLTTGVLPDHNVEYDSDHESSISTVPASPPDILGDFDPPCDSSLQITDVFHCDETIADFGDVLKNEPNTRPFDQSDSRAAAACSSIVNFFSRCRVDLVRCDSEHFDWPSSVKRFDVAERLAEMVRNSQTNPLGNGALSCTNGDDSISCLKVRTGDIQSKPAELNLSNSFKIKVVKNKIISSDSDDKEIVEFPSCYKSLTKLKMKSNKLRGANYLSSSEQESECEEPLVAVPKRRKKTNKPPPEETSNSSVSSHSDILYPSPEVIERIESSAALKIPRQIKETVIVGVSHKRRQTIDHISKMKANPMTCGPNNAAGKEEKSSITASENSNPVAGSVVTQVVSKNPKIGTVLAKKSLKENKKVVKKSKPTSQSRLPKNNSPKSCTSQNNVSKESDLEAEASLKKRKIAVPRIPRRFDSRMNFLLTAEGNFNKQNHSVPDSTKTHKNIPKSETSVIQTALKQDSCLGDSKQTSNFSNGDFATSSSKFVNSVIPIDSSSINDCISVESTAQFKSKHLNRDLATVSSLSTPVVSVTQADPRLVKTSTKSISYGSAEQSTNNPNNLAVPSTFAPDTSVVHSAPSPVKTSKHYISVENSEQSLSKHPNRDNLVTVSLVSTPVTVVAEIDSKVTIPCKKNTTVESIERAFCSSSDKGNITSDFKSASFSKTDTASKYKQVLGKTSGKLPLDSDRKKVAVVSPMERSRDQEVRKTNDMPFLDSLKEKIVNWNPKWLEEQKTNKDPPPEVVGASSPLPLAFQSYKSYATYFHPLILVDMWQSLYEQYIEVFANKNSILNRFYYRVIVAHRKKRTLRLICQSVVPNSLSYQPSEGDIVHLSGYAKPLAENCVLGYVMGHSVEDFIMNKRNIERWSSAIPRESLQDAKLWRFEMCVKESAKHLDIKAVRCGYGLVNIKDALRLVDALHSFRNSPLQESIVRSDPKCFFVPKPESGMSVVEEIAGEMRPKSDAKLFLLHGLPGTGKTETVVQLVEELSRSRSCKLLVCASCDSALDEITHRLVHLKKRKRSNAINFVRLGTWTGIHPSIFSETLYRKTYDLMSVERQRLEVEINRKKDLINEVLFSPGGSSYRNNVNHNVLGKLMDKYKTLQKKYDSKWMGMPKQRVERRIIDESNVILATAGNIPTDLLDGVPFTCCIVDAATQCTELEILQCLLPSINKLVLLGDCGQLPPQVRSQFAFQCGYGRSLFERLCLFFKEQYKRIPFVNLKDQYRMRPELCRFPFSYFYSEEFTVRNKNRHSLLRPIIMYDVMTDGMLYQNDQRPAQVIAYMCGSLLAMDSNLKIGLIGNNQHELVEYRNGLSEQTLRRVEVNLLENFQSREKDVMIVPYCRYSACISKTWACDRRLNVTLTRARQCLIILGHVSYLMHFKHWNDLIDDTKRRNNYIGVAFFKDIPLLFNSTVIHNEAACSNNKVQ